MKNYYDILEVSRKASKDTINKIFKITEGMVKREN